jgi:hydroxymethylpyrimidine kinase/phosphomethylpyrimidine kinase
VLSDIGADAIKTGMLANEAIVEAVARKVRAYGLRKLVVDPVMVAKSGDALLEREARDALIGKLLPLALVVTPNLPEASVLTGMRIRSLDGAREAARRIRRMGPAHVVVKGGHLRGKAIDLFFDGKDFLELQAERIDTKNTHGTGCTFSAAIATFLAQGDSVVEAVKMAKAFITTAITSALPLGHGAGPTNHFAWALREIERYQVIRELKEAFGQLKAGKISHLIPEISSNLGYGLTGARSSEDVAAFPGRIVRLRETVAAVEGPDFGASQHVARIILTVMRRDPEWRSAMNIRYSKETLGEIAKKGFTVGRFDRRLEPRTVKAREGSSLEWGTEEVLKKAKAVPDFIYDEGDVGKEPMIRVLGRTPRDVVQKILKIAGGK